MTKKNSTFAILLPGVISCVVAVALIVIKFYAYLITGSTLIFTDALENIVNLVSAISLVMVLYIASHPPDKNHPYGHGKIEYFAAAFEGGAIAFAGIFIFIEVLQAFMHQAPLNNLGTGLMLVTAAGFINGSLGLWLIKKGKQNNSIATESSGRHLLSDFKTSVGVLVGLALVHFTNIWWLDPVIATIVALHLAWEGGSILWKSGSSLMDALDLDLVNELHSLLSKHRTNELIQVHSLRVMKSGKFHHVDLHMILPKYWDIKKSHDYAEKLEKQVISDYTFDGEFHFHVDPCSTKFCKSCAVENCAVRKSPCTETTTLKLEDVLSLEDSH